MDLFDIIGPIMIGPSSSHTAGAARIGNIVRRLLGEELLEADIAMHGSFAKTYKGHGTDRAVIGGLLGIAVDDTRLRDALTIAAEKGLKYSIRTISLADAHPNTILIKAIGKSGRSHTVQAASIGGGRIEVQSVDGFEAGFTGDWPTLLVQHMDRPGLIASVSRQLAKANVNIASMRVFRSRPGGPAVMVLEMDEMPDAKTLDTLKKLEQVSEVTLLDRLGGA